jgi:hypothetical protein
MVDFKFDSGTTADAASISISFENKKPFPHGKSFASFFLCLPFGDHWRVRSIFVA